MESSLQCSTDCFNLQAILRPDDGQNSIGDSQARLEIMPFILFHFRSCFLDKQNILHIHAKRSGDWKRLQGINHINNLKLDDLPRRLRVRDTQFYRLVFPRIENRIMQEIEKDLFDSFRRIMDILDGIDILKWKSNIPLVKQWLEITW